VVWTQRFLEPANLEFGEGLRATQCGLRVPYATGIDQQSCVARAFAGAAHQFEIERLALAHRFPAELDGLVTGFHPASRDRAGFIAILAEQNRGIGFNAVVAFTAEQTVDRLFESLPFKVP